MARMYFRSTDEALSQADIDRGVAGDGEVNEQHPLPIQLAWRREGDDDWSAVDGASPLPVAVGGIALFSTKLAVVRTPIPGIGTGSAYTSGDAFGTKFTLAVPNEGTIASVIFRDYDDEGLGKEIVLFSENFTQTTDNDAFAPTDIDLVSCIGVISIVSFYNFSANQVGMATPALYYVAPKGLLYGQVVTRGADNIAAGAIPDFTLVIT